MKFFKLLILILSVFKFSKARERSTDGRIVGGKEIDIETAPFQVGLLLYGGHICGGSILSCKYVLTASHCIETYTPSIYSVRAGSSMRESGGSIHDVSRIDIHPLWNPNLYDYDAAILTLRNLIRYDASRQAIQLPFLNEVIFVGTDVATSGWGLTQNDNESRDNLRMVELKVVNQILCNNAHLKDGGVTLRMVCAAADNKDSCNGDSGGPLWNIRTRRLIGIVSFGQDTGCAINGIPGVYTRVAAIRPWIRTIVGF
ncbi:hypothetical protein PVAND_004561 [Polypedilum vanderplanki]|uniref:trypsin n=1 Tax=Polypedilum vanderplanki TaxID=319348 RepID=A0A9J6BXK9_POLVA|nr:hypothetical protein PVAND_004561 [Polypedilum vanderplanki]